MLWWEVSGGRYRLRGIGNGDLGWLLLVFVALFLSPSWVRIWLDYFAFDTFLGARCYAQDQHHL